MFLFSKFTFFIYLSKTKFTQKYNQSKAVLYVCVLTKVAHIMTATCRHL